MMEGAYLTLYPLYITNFEFFAGSAVDRDTMAAVPLHHPGAGAAARPPQIPPSGAPY